MSTGKKTYRVRELATLANVTVRTLHHYDAIGLLRPSGRSERGYRLYGRNDLLRLQQIAIHRELGLSLQEIQQLLDDRRFDYRAALVEQRRRLAAERERTSKMIAAVDRALSQLRTGEEDMDDNQLFDGFDPAKYQDEAQERWGATEPLQISVERTRSYGDEEWQRIKAEAASIYQDVARAVEEGIEPESADGRALAERHRKHIDHWFYPCSRAMHLQLAQLYESDSRFSQNMDKHGPGVTHFLVLAIRSQGTTWTE